MKISVFGGTNNKNYSAEEKRECEKLGKYFGEHKDELLTGGCGGYPYFVSAVAVQNGSRVWGYSPAANEAEHVQKFGYPTNGVTDMIYKGSGQPAKSPAQKAENLLRRMQDMVPFASVAVALGGSWGTLYELTLAFWYKHTVILVESFGGAVEAFANLYDFMGARDVNPDVHFGAKIIRVKDIDGAIAELEKHRRGALVSD